MEGVVPLGAEARERVDGPAPVAEPRPPVTEEAEALAALSDLVSGAAHFDITETRGGVDAVLCLRGWASPPT